MQIVRHVIHVRAAEADGDRFVSDLELRDGENGNQTLLGNRDGVAADRAYLDKLLQKAYAPGSYIDDWHELGTALRQLVLDEAQDAAFRDRVQEMRASVGRGNFVCQVRLVLPEELEYLPWEAMYDEYSKDFYSIDPDYLLIRQTDTNTREAGKNERSALRVLVVIPEGSGLDAAKEWNKINGILSGGDGLVEVERMSGRVTVEDLEKALTRQSFDIFHFIGHGERGERRARIRLNGQGEFDDHWVEADAFADSLAPLLTRAGVQLALLNCCSAGVAAPGIGGLGSALLRKGIPAVVAMQREIDDPVAISFSTYFYRELVGRAHPGDVAFAVQNARLALRRGAREGQTGAFTTPILSLGYTVGTLFDISREDPPTPQPLRQQSSRTAVPGPLVDALKRNRCIVILGPRYFNADATIQRRAAQPPGPLTLARRLAEKLDLAVQPAGDRTDVSSQQRVAELDDLELQDADSDWYGDIFLQRVCQRFEDQKGRGALTQVIREALAASEVPPMVQRIAEWKPRALVCTFYDGKVHQALTAQGELSRYAVGIGTDIGAASQQHLIHLRGSIFTNESDLVLTEFEYDDLLARIPAIAAQVRTFVNLLESGTAFLILGVSPRDRMLRLLMRETSRDLSKSPLFYMAHHRPAGEDKAYWQQLRGRWSWVEGELSDIVEAISQAVRGGA
jgi:hypothetical protein